MNRQDERPNRNAGKGEEAELSLWSTRTAGEAYKRAVTDGTASSGKGRAGDVDARRQANKRARKARKANRSK